MTPPAEGSDGLVVRDNALEASISTAMVQILHGLTGRGPPKARTTIGKDVVTCVLSATLTKGEQSLVSNARDGTVLRGRRDYQDLMRIDAIAAVERLTGRTVQAFMSTNHIDPDLAAEIFILAPRDPIPA
jgi:uncharacterized protein YbcI